MKGRIPQSILDSLTDVPMPRGFARPAPAGTLRQGGFAIPRYRCGALVVGSGAAGLRAAVELRRRGVDVMVLTRSWYGGTSACSGSDKQTLHTAALERTGDDFFKVAEALGAGGAMDADTAYVEAVGSVEALAGLKHLGLPLPEDRWGGVLRYQTDHDAAGRATSCGPRTSRLMVRVLAQEAARLGVAGMGETTALRVLAAGAGRGRRASGLVAASPRARTGDNPFGLVLVECAAIVLAGGGPGELYRDSVYPPGCFGVLGLALEAGIEAANLTESQFGIGTTRETFPWNLSGTYVQCLPRLYSADSSGREHAFLASYYRTTQELASNVFRKGYQWPFHAPRTLDYGSSLVDLAIERERRAGRTVWMDFRRNPEGVPVDRPFSLERLDADVSAYLRNNGALQPLPIGRLRAMNPLAIELYARCALDLARQPLLVGVNNQHMNGGLAVDTWGATSLDGCYAVGEAAGTHGVTRPGGAALVAGQVMAIRCAKHIRARLSREPAFRPAPDRAAIAGLAAELGKSLAAPDGLDPDAVRREIQARMSDGAGFLCTAAGVARALDEARALNGAIAARGIRAAGPGRLAESWLWRQMALASEAVLTALDAYIRAGGGSRGARAVCSPQGRHVPQSRLGPLEEFRFVAERPEDRTVQLRVRRDPGSGRFTVRAQPVRPLGSMDGLYFEKNWPAYLTGEIYRSSR
ncbi:MAG TPA: FAD-binding protein [Vicinamibacterales bacterium]|nr:FAD-binding protein [Vicinamibacterales bacterium]HPW20400.1 FAD-binding protein [Vicinamibacterales bacterium]